MILELVSLSYYGLCIAPTSYTLERIVEDHEMIKDVVSLWPKKSNVQLVVKALKDKHQLWTGTMVSNKLSVLRICVEKHLHEYLKLINILLNRWKRKSVGLLRTILLQEKHLTCIQSKRKISGKTTSSASGMMGSTVCQWEEIRW